MSVARLRLRFRRGLFPPELLLAFAFLGRIIAVKRWGMVEERVGHKMHGLRVLGWPRLYLLHYMSVVIQDYTGLFISNK